jgi:hypothetical protein
MAALSDGIFSQHRKAHKISSRAGSIRFHFLATINTFSQITISGSQRLPSRALSIRDISLSIFFTICISYTFFTLPHQTISSNSAIAKFRFHFLSTINTFPKIPY